MPAIAFDRFYRILPEGTMEGWDGFMFHVKKNKQVLELNRYFTYNRGQEFKLTLL